MSRALTLDGQALDCLPDLAVKAAMPVRVDLGRHEVECACKRGKRTGRRTTRLERRVPNEECQGPVDYMLLSGPTGSSLTRILPDLSGAHDVSKG
jgi:hypothetical protein